MLVPVLLLDNTPFARQQFSIQAHDENNPVATAEQLAYTAKTHVAFVQDTTDVARSEVTLTRNWDMGDTSHNHSFIRKWWHGTRSGAGVYETGTRNLGVEATLTSPEIVVSQDADFTMTLVHQYDFETHDNDLVVIGVSRDDGASWTWHRNFSAESSSGPETQVINFGRQYAGETVRVRFWARFDSRYEQEYGFWALHQVAFSGIDNAPFWREIPDANLVWADAGPDACHIVGEWVTLDGRGSSNRRTSPLNFGWQQISGPEGEPAVFLIDSDTAQPKFLAATPGVYSFGLLATDPATGIGASDGVVIEVVSSLDDCSF